MTEIFPLSRFCNYDRTQVIIDTNPITHRSEVKPQKENQDNHKIAKALVAFNSSDLDDVVRRQEVKSTEYLVEQKGVRAAQDKPHDRASQYWRYHYTK